MRGVSSHRSVVTASTGVTSVSSVTGDTGDPRCGEAGGGGCGADNQVITVNIDNKATTVNACLMSHSQLRQTVCVTDIHSRDSDGISELRDNICYLFLTHKSLLSLVTGSGGLLLTSLVSGLTPGVWVITSCRGERRSLVTRWSL